MTDTATTFRKWRIKNKLTQLQVARELGVSREAVTQYEGGVFRPGVGVLKKYARLMRVPMESLV
jgi:transcriptional regulator with XRE-family HTH domain